VEELGEQGRSGQSDWQLMEPSRCLENALVVVGGEISAKAEIVRAYAGAAPVRCRASQLCRVFSALLVNAAQAIADRGTITLRTRLRGDEVHVDVEDTGCGIPRENLSRIFEPFFTTHSAATSTGLGLSMAYGIVEEHGGRIEVESEPGRGSRFRVCLPVARAGEAMAPQGSGVAAGPASS